MNELKSGAEALWDGSRSLFDYLYELAEGDKDSRTGQPAPDTVYWNLLREAEKAGKKLILINGPGPAELIYALDMVPVYLDLIPGRLLSDSTLTARLIHLTEARANDKLCSLHKSLTGLVLAKGLGRQAAGYVGMPIPCDSARTACTETARYLELPAFQFDPPLIPKKRSSLNYLSVQLERFITFLEEIAGKKLDWDAVKEKMGLYNQAVRLLEDCRRLRKQSPCPLSSRMVLQHELINAMGPTAEISAILEAEKNRCAENLAAGGSPCVQGERRRVFLLHNLIFLSPRLTDWLEERYGAVTVLDGYGLEPPAAFTDLDDRAACLLQMAERMAAGSLAHGTGPSGGLTEGLDKAMADFRPDVFLFLGSRGCRQVWGETKQLSDALQERYGKSMLMLDMDNTDLRYQSLEAIQKSIAQYIDTVVEG